MSPNLGLPIGPTFPPIQDGRYQFDQEVARSIAGDARGNTVDAIIIVNNEGIGSTYARHVSLDLRHLVIIVSNNPLSAVERAPYEELGITHFALRGPEMVEAIYQLICARDSSG